jgi:hypothetical protein
MTTFFVDLWHDLREKRLWPVAVGLLAAIVAVPVLLFKPAGAPTAPATVAPPRSTLATLPVVAVDAGPTEGSRLEAFNQKNPFKPMKDLAKDTATSSSSSAASKAGGSASGATLGGGSSSSSKSVGGSSSSSSSGSGGSSSGGSTPSSGATTPSTAPATPAVQWFHYTADFSFGAPGSLTKIKDAASFTLLPDDQHPSITFMGVADDHKSAVFFIADPGFTGAGEGKCNAKGAACRFITLRLADTHNEETFTSTDGSVTYDLKLLAIHRRNLSTDGSGNPKPAPKAAGKSLDATGAGVAVTTATTQRLLPGLIADGPGVARATK